MNSKRKENTLLNKVLVVDDDRVLLFRIQKKSEEYRDRFTLLLAQNGREAVETLKNEDVSLVVTDLQMPEMDGFELLAYMSENYPDIPVIILTAHGTAQSRRTVLAGGAVGFIEKPVDLEDLAQKICATLDETTDGGAFQVVPLDLFSHLVVMEKKTCTLRVKESDTGLQGVLFFKDGDLINARLSDRQGTHAAQEIFSWVQSTYSMQYGCGTEEKKIEGGLQDVVPIVPSDG